MASSAPFTTQDLTTKRHLKNEKSPSQKETLPKERICNMVLRDEDEETDDEDLTIDPNSPVNIVEISIIFIRLSAVTIKSVTPTL